ncbi:MAG: metallophosphoesterase [Deltaproteobacteria bacterium]
MLEHLFTIGSVIAATTVVLLARTYRGILFSRFATAILTVHTLSSVALFDHVGRWWPLFVYLQLATYVHFGTLVWARLRPLPWRLLVSIPAHAFSASIFFAVPWAIAAAIGFEPKGLIVPFVLGLLGLVEAFLPRQRDVHVDLSEQRPATSSMIRARTSKGASERPLRIVQITDPHLGPFMSASRLARICERAVERDPDLVLLTGDFITMESQRSADPLAEAFAPLAKLDGRVFACLGNHDYEALAVVKEGLSRANIRLLVDEEATVQTEAGAVQVVGVDFVWRERRAHLASLFARIPRRDDHVRVVLLHDPGAFAALPQDEGDLVLSGHTHGGQLGLVTFGLPITVLSLFTQIPDHGLWARGRDRLYVHRGTGHYGFPLRVGVPREESLLHVHRG